MNIVFYTHNLINYKFYKYIQNEIMYVQKSNYFEKCLILDDGEYRTSDKEEKVDFWIKKYFFSSRTDMNNFNLI